MPGRRSSELASLKKSRPSKVKAKRSQNALAIAEQQDPVRSKIRQNRLGQIELQYGKRRRSDSEENKDSELEEGRNGNVKRQKAGNKYRIGDEIERGSDSSGNEWVLGHVDDDDEDSDINSDEAMAESDNEGAAIRGSMAYSATTKFPPRATKQKDDKLYNIDLREDRDVDGVLEGDSDSFGDEAVDLAAMIDESDDGEGLPKVQKQVRHEGDVLVEEESDGGADIKPASEDEESTLSFSEPEDESGDTKRLASLHTLVSTLSEQDQGSTRSRVPTDTQESTTPSEFGLNPKRKLTVADLVPSVTDPKLRKSLKLLADDETKSPAKRGGIPKKLDVPLPKRQQDRLDRAAAYEKSKETLNRWIDTVKHNRRAEHLSFPLKDPTAATALGSTQTLSTSQSQPLTDLESTIHSILQDSGLAAPDGKTKEYQLQAFEELKTNKMPLEEVQARRAELRKARELLFREEIRAKRIKKIKSKTYRKVHRKERERTSQQEKDALAAAGMNDSESEQERRDRQRAEERMGARHRESKWAKGVKESGRAKWDEDARGGVTEMARRGEELKRRIQGKAVTEDDDSTIASESEEDEVIDDLLDRDNRHDRKYRKQLRELDEGSKKLESDAGGSKLASMDFMKNAESARKARNEADLESLRRDLAGEETPTEDDGEGPGRMIFGPAKSKPSSTNAPPIVSKSEFEEKEDPEIKDGRYNDEKPEEEELEVIVDGSNAKPVTKSSISDRRKKSPETSREAPRQADENPWLMPRKTKSKTGKKRPDPNDGPIVLNTLTTETLVPTSSKSAPRSALKGARKAEQARQSVQDSTMKHLNEGSDHEEDVEDAHNSPFVLRNQDLVRRAFAGDEVIADFEAEKRATVKDEEEKVLDKTLPGWGTWTGAGLGKKQQKRNKGKVLIKQPGIAKEKRQDAKLDRVIINEKRVKKNGKYLASSLPHPFETKQQYQRSLRMPVGPEFTTKLAFQDATKPRILMKQGIITPMVKPMV